MIPVVPMIMGDVCPACATELTSLPDAAPWCPACEWNLDHFPQSTAHSWFWRKMRVAERAAGFRSDRELAGSTDESPVGRNGHRVLLAISAALMLTMVAAFAGGLWLVVDGGPLWPIVSGLLLLVLAAVLRPRFGRLRPILAGRYRIEKKNAPMLHTLIDRIAGELDAPKPDILLIDYDWNAGVITTGIRRTRVMVIGVRLLLALQAPQVIALLGHELGHLKYDDTRRGLLTGPARRTFGALSDMVRPPHRLGIDIGLRGPSALALLIWQVVGGTASWLMYAAHLAVNVVGARDDRTIELRADAAAAHVAGTSATLEMLDVLAMLPSLTGYVQRHVDRGEAASSWRRFLRAVQEREVATVPAWRQLSIRRHASIFSSHPAPGRRHQWLTARPTQPGVVTLTETEAARIEREVAPYAEALHSRMLDRARD